MLFTVELIFNL